jgi:peroxiredoxin
MKGSLTILLSVLLQLFFSCTSHDAVEQARQTSGETKIETSPDSEKQNFVIDPAATLKDFITWYNYTYHNIRLAQDFIGLNVDSVAIPKNDFLTNLETGNFVPFKVDEQNKKPVYKLYRLRQKNQDIQSVIKQLAATEIEHARMEGSVLPGFDFTDLNGKTYNKASTKGTVLLLKCWFINCVACVKEFPDLNRLVVKYQAKNDLLFVSLATDSKEKLVSFLSKREFKYAVVPDAEEFISDKLGVANYPTHILVDRNGKIIKVTNAVEDIIPFLEKQIETTIL